MSSGTSSFASELELEKAVVGLSGIGTAHPIKLLLKALSLSSRFGSADEVNRNLKSARLVYSTQVG